MPEYDVLLGDDAREFLDVADEKTERICKENLGYLAENPYPGRGCGDKEKLPIDGRRDTGYTFLEPTRVSTPSWKTKTRFVCWRSCLSMRHTSGTDSERLAQDPQSVPSIHWRFMLRNFDGSRQTGARDPSNTHCSPGADLYQLMDEQRAIPTSTPQNRQTSIRANWGSVQDTLLNPMMAWGSLFESLFEGVDCGGQHEFAELTIPSTRMDSGTEPALDSRKGGLGQPTRAV